MPIHDWSRVPAGIFHDFHHGLIEQIKRDLNGGVLPPDYYALAEPFVGGLDPEVIARNEMEVYRRKQDMVAVRHERDDQLVAVVAVVSPGNKSTRPALEQFVRKATDFLNQRIHLVVLDLLPPGPYDPQGIHGAIWEYIDSQTYPAPTGKPLTLAAYVSDRGIEAFVEPVAVGDALPEMPLFLEPGRFLEMPLEDLYSRAWAGVPQRWKRVVEPPR